MLKTIKHKIRWKVQHYYKQWFPSCTYWDITDFDIFVSDILIQGLEYFSMKDDSFDEESRKELQLAIDYFKHYKDVEPYVFTNEYTMKRRNEAFLILSKHFHRMWV